MKKLNLLSLAVVLLLLACGGDDGGDNEDPAITISAPTNGQTYSVPDTLDIRGNAMDDVEITAISFNNGAEDTALDISNALDKTSIDFTISLALEEGTPAGDYEVTITATDNANAMVTETVEFTVQ